MICDLPAALSGAHALPSMARHPVETPSRSRPCLKEETMERNPANLDDNLPSPRNGVVSGLCEPVLEPSHKAEEVTILSPNLVSFSSFFFPFPPRTLVLDLGPSPVATLFSPPSRLRPTRPRDPNSVSIPPESSELSKAEQQNPRGTQTRNDRRGQHTLPMGRRTVASSRPPAGAALTACFGLGSPTSLSTGPMKSG